MKILQVIPKLTVGGAEKVVVDLSNYLQQNQIQVTILCSSVDELETLFLKIDSRIKIINLFSDKNSKPIIYLKMLRWIKQNRDMLIDFDFIHTHLTYGLIFGTTSKFFLTKKHVVSPKIIFTCHLVGMKVSVLKLFLHSALSRYFNAFVLMGIDKFWESRQKHKRNIKIIENGISIPGNIEKVSSSKIRIGSISRLVSERKPQLLINAFYEIAKRIPNAIFSLGGEGPELPTLLHQVRSLSLSEKVTFLGKLHDSKQILTELDFYITLNVRGTTGIAGLEAISCGIPTVGIQLDASHKKGEEDWISSFTSLEGLAEFVERLLSDKNFLEKYTRFQEKVFKEKFTIKVMGDQYFKLYMGITQE